MNKIEFFLINLTVLEGRHFAWQQMDSYVRIKVGNQSRRTGIRKSSDCPYFNEYFVFEFRTDLQSLLDKHIVLSVIKPRKCCSKRKLLGFCTLDVATIWNQPDHIFYQKWAILSSQSTKYAGPRGYLKVTLSIVFKDGQAKLPLANPNINEEIEGNLLLPDGLTLQRERALFIFKIYRGEDIADRKKVVLENLRKPVKNTPLSTFVEVTFAGITASTSVQKYNQNPTWNEQLTIAELFPPLCQRIKIQLRSTSYCRKTNLKAIKYMHLHSIANDQENGFLPTFGPAFVHFYKKDRFGEVYAGKVLMALQTQLQNEYLTKPKSFVKKAISPCFEASLWKLEPVLLFCAILSVSAIDKRFSKKALRFEISVGPTNQLQTGTPATGVSTAPNISSEMKPVTADKFYWYLDFKGKIPCISYQNYFPDLRRRFYNKNMIRKISEELKMRLDEIEPLFRYERCRIPSDIIGKKLEEALQALAKRCRTYIEIAAPTLQTQVTELDKEKTKLCIREMEDIERLAKTLYNYKTKKKSYRKAQKLHTRISLLEDHPQDCWPDILIYMIYNSKKVATRLIESEDVVYSTVEEEMGPLCGKIHSICFDTPLKLKTLKKSIAACKMDLFLWIGLKDNIEQCFNSLPDALKYPDEIAEDAIPRYLILTDKHHFQCRAHIYQGRFSFGADVSGLSDYYVRIILNHESASTEIIKGKLNPLWDETVVIPYIMIEGTRKYIKENPPTCVVEVADFDDIFHSEYVGRVFVKPAVKLRSDPYSKPNFPPVLKWYDIIQKNMTVGKLLLCIELLEITSSERLVIPTKKEIAKIPDDIRPVFSGYKADILFWGVRQLKKLRGIPITKPKIIVDFTVDFTESETATNKFPNFDPKVQDLLVKLPVEQDYIPSLTFQLNDSRSFGRNTYIANHITNIDQFLYYPMTPEERQHLLSQPGTRSYDSMESKDDSVATPQICNMQEEPLNIKEKLEETKERLKDVKKKVKDSVKKGRQRGSMCCRFWKKTKKQTGKAAPISNSSTTTTEKDQIKSAIVEMDTFQDDDTFLDWWTKYFLSVEKKLDSEATVSEESMPTVPSKNFKLKIYEEELEYQPEFSSFQDTIMAFPLIRGERSEDEDVDTKNIMGIFKGNIKMYPWPSHAGINYVSPSGKNLRDGYFQDAPNNENISFIARVYCVRGIKLRPSDFQGNSDPFLVAFMGNQYYSTSKEYIPKDINPIFGKSFEFTGTFPTDFMVTIQVWDYDKHSSHDLIGETTIDLENRFYTKHRARCGIAYEYQEKGPSVWRDEEPPSQILEKLCDFYQLAHPKYYDTYVMIGQLIFSMTVQEGETPKSSYTKEELALDLLHKWNQVPVVGCHLVPEHVETRSLYNSRQPGLEQGKLQLWVDIFPTSDLPPPAPVDITPRKPENYELRVVILNTEEVLLKEDDFFIGEKKSDIFIKGWIVGVDEIQCTDVHYRSLNGEGNFNWRFVLPFTYLKTENKTVIKKKELFHTTESEKKLPCKLMLQVWDNDTFSRDDILGSLTLDLSSMPRGAKTSRLCTMQLLQPGASKINLFKLKRTRGWWPFQGMDDTMTHIVLAGKVEAELEILTEEEANANPAGRGRNEPNALPKPNRPDTSFSLFKNPFKLCKYVVCKHFKGRLIKLLLLAFAVAMILLFFWNFPQYSVKRLLGA